MSTAPRERVVLVKRLSGAELSCGAEIYVGLDNVVGAPVRGADGRWGHYTGLRIRLDGTTDTHADMTQAMPGNLLAAFVQNVRVRAARKDLILGGPDGEDVNNLTQLLFAASTVAGTSDVTDATAQAVATGNIWIDLPFSANRKDRFGREDDGSVPVAAFSRAQDSEHGLRFKFADAVTSAQGNSSFKGFLNVVAKTVVSCDIWATVRYDEHLNYALPGYRVFSEAQASFEIDPVGGPNGATLLLAVVDPPSATTGLRTHANYANIQCSVGQTTLYSGRDFRDLIDMANQADMSINPVYDRVTAKSGMPFFGRRTNQSLGEDCRGRISVTIGTRTTQSQRLLQICRQQDDEAAASVMAQSVGAIPGTTSVATKVATKSPGLASIIDKKLVLAKGQ